MKTLLIGIVISANSFGAVCVAHRGVHGNYVENTMMSVYQAYSSKIGGIEFDIRHSKDGEGFLLHDEELKRVAKNKPRKRCKLKKSISKLSSSDILNNCIHSDGQEIGKFSQAVDMFLSWKSYSYVLPFIFVELKDEPSIGTLRLLSKLAKNYYDGRVFVISFSRKALDKVRNSIKDVKIPLIILSKTGKVDLPVGISGMGFSISPFEEHHYIKKLVSNGKFAYYCD